MEYIKVLMVSAIWVIVILIVVTNKKLRDEILVFVNFRFFKTNFTAKNMMAIFSIIAVIISSVTLLKDAKKTMDILLKSNNSQSEEEYEKNIQKAYDQIFKYNKLMEETKTDIKNCKNPYIPDGFKYVEGSWDNGYVIEDENKNQFVWIPCTNIENNKENIPILSKDIFSDNSVTYFSCSDSEDFEVFLESSLKNGGYYISRFEIGKENGNPVSKADCDIWNNIKYNDAEEIAKNMYSNINSRLINGYSYDTAVQFILDKVDKEKISESTGKTGNKSYKNIYDLIDNNGEWSEEKRDGLSIYRQTVIMNDDLTILADRISGNEKFKDEDLGFRTIIYK